jgi:hypothetical protein
MELEVLYAFMDMIAPPSSYRSRLVTDPEEASRLGVPIGTTIQERMETEFKVARCD